MFQLKTTLCICALFLASSSTAWSAYPLIITNEQGFKAYAMSSPGLGIQEPSQSFFKSTNFPGVVGGTVTFNNVLVVNDGKRMLLNQKMNTIQRQTYTVQYIDDENQKVMRWQLDDAMPIQPTSYGALERHNQLPVFTLQHSGMSMDSE